MSKAVELSSQSPEGTCCAVQKEKDGRLYYTFEFASKASNYIRHALAVVTVGNGELSICKAQEALLLNKMCGIS